MTPTQTAALKALLQFSKPKAGETIVENGSCWVCLACGAKGSGMGITHEPACQLEQYWAALRVLEPLITNVEDETDTPDTPPSPKPVEAAGIFARMEQNSRAVAAMPDYVKGSPVNSRQPAPTPETAPAPRRTHELEYLELPGMHMCRNCSQCTYTPSMFMETTCYSQPVPPQATEGTKAGRRVFITDGNSLIVEEIQPITRERLEEFLQIELACEKEAYKDGSDGYWKSRRNGLAAVLKSLGLPMADEQ